MQNRIFFVLLQLVFLTSAYAQMEINGLSLYGNEWIDYTKKYVKFTTEDEGIYRITYADVFNSGIGSSQIIGSQIELYFRGNRVPVYLSSTVAWSTDDYLEFYAPAQDGWLDQFLFGKPEDQLNPNYSMYTDKAAYFLTLGASNTDLQIQDVDNNLSGNLPAVEPYYMHEELEVYSFAHSNPPATPDFSLQYSHYTAAEGYGGNHTNDFQTTLATGPKYTGQAPKPYMILRQGFYQGQHISEISVNGTIKATKNHLAQSVDQYRVDLDIGDIINNTKINVLGVGNGLFSNIDKSIMSSINLVYPRKFFAQNSDYFRFQVEASSQDRYFEINNFNLTANTVLYDIENQRRIVPNMQNGILAFLLPPSSSKSTLVLTNVRQTAEGFALKTYEDYTSVDPQYLIITSEKLNTGSNSGIQQYADYRASAKGGNRKVTVINVEDILDQFAYGEAGHSIGLNNFVRKYYNTWSNLEDIFLIGKGLDYANYRNNPEFGLPTWGYPGSDNLLLSMAGKTYPRVAAGRLAARNNQTVIDYLNKVKTYEDKDILAQSIEEKQWMKKIIHLSGGSSLEQDVIYSYLTQMEGIIESSEMGADIHTYRKTSTDNVQTTLSEQIKHDINDGAAILTFFGHSSTGTFDFSIEEPSIYENAGKLPIIISLGCHSGDIHSQAFGLSEKFVNEPGVGAIAFLASAGNAQLNAQAQFGLEYYKITGEEMYGLTIGQVIKESKEYILDNFSQDLNFLTLGEQLTLHGDPGLDFLSHLSPDYLPAFDNISTTPEQISSNLDSMTINFDIHNIGSWKEEALNYMLIHDYEEGIDTIYGSTITPRFKKTVSKKFPIQGGKVLGKNVIEIVLDYNNNIEELPNPSAEDNNSLKSAYNVEGFTFYAFDGSAIPVSPAEYAIVVDSDITLKASTNNAFLDKAEYTIQIDTTERFDSPLLRAQNVESYGGLIEWQPTISYTSGTVYYWRIKSNATIESTWTSSSFIYLPEKSIGWNQSHFYQQQDLTYNRMELDSLSRIIDFSYVPIEHKVNNQSRKANQWPAYYVNSDLADINYDTELYSPDIVSGVYVAVIDPETSQPWTMPSGGLYGADSPFGILTGRDRKVFPFSLHNKNHRKQLIDFLNDVIPDGHYVMLFTIQSSVYGYKANEWESDATSFGTNIFEALEAQGATRIRELADNEVPYIISYQKGVGVISEVKAAAVEDIITSTMVVNGKSTNGTVTSTKIGPASKWETLEWKIDGAIANDTFGITIVGIDKGGVKTILAENQTNFNFNLSSVNASTYPYLELRYDAKDDTTRTAPHLDYWRIYYQGVPESVINPNLTYSFKDAVLSKGNTLSLDYAVENISDIDMDSLVVQYSIVDKSNATTVWQQSYAPLAKKSANNLQMTFDTDNLNGGLYELQVLVNPAYQQPEQFLFNNVGILNFEIKNDNLNPLLDVTFDGIRILNGDIVSPKPVIQVCLTDDNLFALLDSPDLFTLTLEYPDGTIENIDVNGPLVTFQPATGGEENKALLLFSPELADGEYTLSAQARDKDGNLSGQYGYTVSFEVVSQTSITNLLNYPNPFSTSTQFVFTATGDNLPSEYILRIYTATGKVVREITQDEMGPLHVGVNRTYYSWNGTDGFGNKLANGVYFYKLFFNQEDSANTEHRSVTQIDDYFKKGFGKLVIIR